MFNLNLTCAVHWLSRSCWVGAALALLIGSTTSVSAQCVHVQDVSGNISGQAPAHRKMM